MKRLYFLEPIIGMYAFAISLVTPLVQQYVYRRLWQELTNTSYPANDGSTSCTTNISNHTNHHESVQQAASLFSMYVELSTVPSLIATLILVSHSDKHGRKLTIIVPIIGFLIYNISFLVVSFLELNVYWLIGASFVSSLFGGFSTVLGGCFSYVADVYAEGKQKTLHMAVVDMVLGLFSGIASISTGYFLRAAGFNWPFLTSSMFLCLNLLCAIFILEESRVIHGSSEDTPERRPPWRLLVAIRQVFLRNNRRRNRQLVLLMVIYITLGFAHTGGGSVIMLYQLNKPLCWSEVLIGYGSALTTVTCLTSFIGVSVLSCCLPDRLVILIGLLSVMISTMLTAFAKTTLMMFLVRIPGLWAIMPFPVLRSMMSRIVSKSEQGALFASLAFLKNLSYSASSTAFTSIYAATVAWCPGFTFLLVAGLCFIPIVLLGCVRPFNHDDIKEVESILHEEEPAAA